jgi:hypothetical protein
VPTLPNLIYLTLQINTGENQESEEIDRLTRHLSSEIGDLEVESVTLTKSGELPEGAKSAEMVTLGSLAVVVLPVVIPKLIELLHSWSTRGENRTVKIKAQVEDRSIELEYSPAAMSPDELKQLVQTLTVSLPSAGKKEAH